jgi:hypothetical protein
MKSAEFPGVDYVSDVVEELDRQIDAVQRANKCSSKSMKVKSVAFYESARSL